MSKPLKLRHGLAAASSALLIPALRKLYPNRMDEELVQNLSDASVFSWWFVSSEVHHAHACCIVTRGFDFVEITDLFVEDEMRRNRLASKLLDVVIEAAELWGIENVGLEVRVSNSAALALYASFDFLPVRIRKGYYRDPDEDAVVLQKSVRRSNKTLNA